MSTYSNNPKQSIWEIWFVTSIILFISMMIWGTSDVELPVIYDGLLFAIFLNLVYCIYKGVQK